MMTRYFERRKFIRIPASGPATFRCGRGAGDCELVDISPGGVGLRCSARKAPRLGERVSIQVEMPKNSPWHLPEIARVVRREIEEDGVCSIGLAFSDAGA